MLHLVIVRIPPDGAAVRNWATFLTSAERGYAGTAARRRAHRGADGRPAGGDGVLGWEAHPPWRAIEVVRGPAGEPRVSLGGEAERAPSVPGAPGPRDLAQPRGRVRRGRGLAARTGEVAP